MPLVVYKLGGSLLSLSDLGPRLTRLLKEPVPLPDQFGNPPVQRAVLVGGGAAADLVRNWDRVHNLGGKRSHDLALAAMAFNTRLVSSLVPDSVLVAKRSLIRRACSNGAIALLDPELVVEEAERKSTRPLPRSWTVTSDSIAAFLAAHWRAAALVLIKSRPRPLGKAPMIAARDELVDKQFPRLAAQISVVAWASLRSKRAAIERWL